MQTYMCICGVFYLLEIIFFPIVGFFVGYIGGLVLGKIVGGIVGLCIVGKKEKEADERYERARQRYDKQVEQDKLRVKKELKQVDSLKSIKSSLLDQREKTLNQLNIYYDMVGIDKDYRNLIPIGYMNDYIRLGISNQLHGPNGLNYFIRQELKTDMLQMTMEEISAKLNTLMEINQAVYRELVSINSKCDEMISEISYTAQAYADNNRILHDIKDSQSMNTYYNSKIAKELEYRNQMDEIYGRWL